VTRRELDDLVYAAQELAAERSAKVDECDRLAEECKVTQVRLQAMLDQIKAGLEELRAVA
jgi:hypothetical protein